MRKLNLFLAMALAFTNPAAHADKDTIKLISAALMGGGLGSMITTCGGSSGSTLTGGAASGGGCQMGMLLTMLGGVGLLFGMKEDKPKEVRCYTDATGMQKVVMYGQNGQQAQFVQPGPGQPIAYPPTNMPSQYAQNISGQVVQLCQQPQLISNVNTALVAPAPAAQPQILPYPAPVQQPVVNTGQPALILPRSVASDPWATQSH